MSRFAVSSIVLTLVVAGAATSAQAQDANTKQMIALYDKLAMAIQGGKPDPKTLVSLANPGLQITPGFDQRNEEDKNMLYMLFDDIPSASAIYQPSKYTYSGIYDKILRDLQYTETPLTDAEKKTLADLLAIVEPSSPEMTKYKEYQQKYLDAQSTMYAALAEYTYAAEDQKLFRVSQDAYQKMSPEDQKVYQGDKRAADARVAQALQAKSAAEVAFNDAYKAWMATGRKTDIDTAYNKIDVLSNKDAGAWWQKLKDRFKLAERGNYHDVQFFPAPDTWNRVMPDGKKDPSWMKFKFSSSEKSSESKASAKAFHAEASFNSGKLSVGASSSYSRELADAASKDESFSFEVELKKVAIFRPWLEMQVFKNKNWWFNDNSKGDVISYGDPAHPKFADGFMPLYNHSIILARNLKMKAKIFQEQSHKFAEALKVEAHVSYGPFSISGGYSQSDKHEHQKSSINGSEISCPGVQILGYISSVVDKSPAKTVK